MESSKGELAVVKTEDDAEKIAQKRVKVDVVWTINVDEFTTRTTPGKEVLDSPGFDVAHSHGVPTRCWSLRMRLSDRDNAVGMSLIANENQMNIVTHEASFTFFIGGDGIPQTNAVADHRLFVDDSESWGTDHFTNRSRLFGAYLKDSKITVKASITVYEHLAEDNSRHLQIRKLAKLFDEQKLGDFTISCEGEDIKVYKWVLEMGSPVFAAMLSSGMKETNDNRLVIEDLSLETTKNMLKFLYTGELLYYMDEDDLLEAAHKYDIGPLKLLCTNKLIYCLDVENACRYFKLADDCAAPRLMKAADKVICDNYDEAVETEDWHFYIGGNYELGEGAAAGDGDEETENA